MKKRRLGGKTVPSEAPAFPQRPLLNRTKFRILQHKLKQHELEQRRAARSIRAESVRLLGLQFHGNGAEDTDKEYELPAPTHVPHPSHWISTLAGNQRAIWCKACGSWSISTNLKGLSNICKGLHRGRNSTLRLLQCGILPVAGARLPPNEH